MSPLIKSGYRKPSAFPVTPAPISVIPASPSVIPAQAGTHARRSHSIPMEYSLSCRLIPVLGLIMLTAACSTPAALSKPGYAPTAPVSAAKREPSSGSIYSSSNNHFLFEDQKARRVGDLITVILQEQTKSAKKATTSTKKDSAINIPAPTIMGHGITYKGKSILANSIQSGSTFTGEGGSNQSNSLSGNITVTVAQVLPNGNLVVRGEKLLTLNQGSEVVRISGIIRPVDINPNNSIRSTQIANAKITYGGNGLVADSNKAGWLTRFFNSSVWPF